MEVTETQIPVTFTDAAIEELKKVLTQASHMYIRVGVKGGGCSGMTYILGTEHQQTETDLFGLVSDIPVIVDKRHLIYLLGMEVDFSSGLNARGFEFKNPNAKTTCGCGTSFAV